MINELELIQKKSNKVRRNRSTIQQQQRAYQRISSGFKVFFPIPLKNIKFPVSFDEFFGFTN